MVEPNELDRRAFFGLAGRVGLLAVAGPGLWAACGTDEPALEGQPDGTQSSPSDEPRAVVGDVEDFALTSDEWDGDFGFVTFALHEAVVDGNAVYYIRTDASDRAYAEREGLVFVPRIAGLVQADLVGAAYLVNGRPAVLSTEPGRDDYTPAWRVHNVSFTGESQELTSVDAVLEAERSGALTVEQTDVVLNAMVVKWSSGELPVDTERTEYLGPGQLLEPVDTSAMRVTFKLHECYPGVRYIVTDTSLAPMAEGMKVAHSPSLKDSMGADATGRTNVFMNGIDGSGPMGFQPSVFDSQAGEAAWSPYWDHMTYAWTDTATPRVLTDEDAVHAARDDGDLDEFPGTPDTGGEIFVVNCPVPVLAPNTFEA